MLRVLGLRTVSRITTVGAAHASSYNDKLNELPEALKKTTAASFRPVDHRNYARKRLALTRRQFRAKNQVPTEFFSYDEGFDKVVGFDTQLKALEMKGFMRPYKEYRPPDNFEELFTEACTEAGVTAREPLRPDSRIKAEFLHILERKFKKHRVPNSMLHSIDSVDKARGFYSSTVETTTPYEKLYRDKQSGRSPPNLHIQLEAKRFDPEGDHPFDRVSAFPNSTAVLVTPEARKKYKQHTPIKNPYILSPSEFHDRHFIKDK